MAIIPGISGVQLPDNEGEMDIWVVTDLLNPPTEDQVRRMTCDRADFGHCGRRLRVTDVSSGKTVLFCSNCGLRLEFPRAAFKTVGDVIDHIQLSKIQPFEQIGSKS